MKDAYQQDLEIGDSVVFCNWARRQYQSKMGKGIVIGFTKTTVIVAGNFKWAYNTSEGIRYHDTLNENLRI